MQGYPSNRQQGDEDLKLNSWVEDCLKQGDDNSIIQAICGMRKIQPQRVVDAVNDQFSDFTEMIGTRRIRVRLISVPIAFTSDEMLDEACFEIDEITPYLNAFYRHGLLEHKNGGVVMLRQLIDHTIIESVSLSDLYALSRAIFNCAKSGFFEAPSIESITKDTDPRAGWMYVPDGYYTMRHMLGVIFWDEDQLLPPIAVGKGDIEGWQNTMINHLTMGAFANQEHLEVNILPPGKLFDAVFNATVSMVEKVALTLAVEAKDQAGEVEAKLIVGCDPGMPGRSQIKLEMISRTQPQQLIASAAIRLSIMESMEVGAVLGRIEQILVEQKIEKAPVAYYSGSVCGDEQPDRLH